MALQQPKGKKSDPGVDDRITIELHADGSTNLTRRLWMRISDKLTLLFPRTAYGILNEGGWRNIEEEAPKPPKRPLGLKTGYTPVKSHEDVESGGGASTRQTPARSKKATEETIRSAVSEFADEEALAVYETQRIIYHEELKMYVRDKKEYHLEVIKMHAILHAMLSPEAAEKIEKSENYETEIARPRNGEKLCDIIRKVLVVGIVGPSHEVNRRAAEKRWESVCQEKEPEESLTNYKERFNDQYDKFVGAGGTKLEQTDLAKRFMWTLDVDRYAEAISSILNDESSGKTMPETVEAMCERVRKHVSLKPSTKRSKEKSEESEVERFVYAVTKNKSDARKPEKGESDSDADTDSVRNKRKKDKWKSESGNSESVSGKTNKNGKTYGACHECGEEGHYATDCELRKALNKVKADFKKKKAASGFSSSELSKQVKECVEELAREREQRKSKDDNLVAFTWGNEMDLASAYSGPYGL